MQKEGEKKKKLICNMKEKLRLKRRFYPNGTIPIFIEITTEEKICFCF